MYWVKEQKLVKERRHDRQQTGLRRFFHSTTAKNEKGFLMMKKGFLDLHGIIDFVLTAKVASPPLVPFPPNLLLIARIGNRRLYEVADGRLRLQLARRRLHPHGHGHGGQGKRIIRV